MILQVEEYPCLADLLMYRSFMDVCNNSWLFIYVFLLVYALQRKTFLNDKII